MPVIAIFDVGKTHKKVFLLDEDYNVRLEQVDEIPETHDESGFPCEDLDVLTAWIFRSLDNLLDKDEFEVMALNFSAYGASLVHLDKDGLPLTPLYNYLRPFPDSLQGKFYGTYGGQEMVSVTTASPASGSLNSGLQLYRLKNEQPELFQKIKVTLHLPHYLSYLFTREPYSNITSVGCHTCLWDFNKHQYHRWVTDEGILGKLAPDIRSDEVTAIRRKGKMLATGHGLHDSSAALIPYLKQFHDPFVLLSTGTWNIALNPFNSDALTAEELDRDCLCYLSYEGKTIKSARLFAGFVHQQQAERIAEHFHQLPDFHNTLAYDRSLVSSLHVSPTASPKDLTTRNFFEHDLKKFTSAVEAYHCLVAELVAVQVGSVRMILQPQTRNLFVDGGFSRNEIFMEMLKESLPQLIIRVTFVPQASAIGAAMAIHASWNRRELSGDIVKLK